MRATKLQTLKTNYKFEAPLVPAMMPAGLSDIADQQVRLLDLNAYLAPYPENIFLVRVKGESMINANIFDGDILVVDSREKPANGKIVIASINGDMAVKYFRQNNEGISLVSANEKFSPIKIGELFEFQIQGVVKHVIHDV